MNLAVHSLSKQNILKILIVNNEKTRSKGLSLYEFKKVIQYTYIFYVMGEKSASI